MRPPTWGGLTLLSLEFPQACSRQALSCSCQYARAAQLEQEAVALGRWSGHSQKTNSLAGETVDAPDGATAKEQAIKKFAIRP